MSGPVVRSPMEIARSLPSVRIERTSGGSIAEVGQPSSDRRRAPPALVEKLSGWGGATTVGGTVDGYGWQGGGATLVLGLDRRGACTSSLPRPTTYALPPLFAIGPVGRVGSNPVAAEARGAPHRQCPPDEQVKRPEMVP